MSGVMIPVTGGYSAFISPEDEELVSRYRWVALVRPGKNTVYARAWDRDGDQSHVLMHRLILQPPPHVLIDHRDGDGLNNRRANLRCASNQQNVANSGPRRTNKLGYKGVHILPSGRFRAYIRKDGERYNLGVHDTAELAAAEYDAMALRLFGEFAYQNLRSQYAS